MIETRAAGARQQENWRAGESFSTRACPFVIADSSTHRIATPLDRV